MSIKGLYVSIKDLYVSVKGCTWNHADVSDSETSWIIPAPPMLVYNIYLQRWKTWLPSPAPPPFTVIHLNLRTAWLQTCEATPHGKQLHHLEGGLGLALLLLRGLPLVLVNLSSSRVTLASISITPNRLHSGFHAYSCPVLGFFLTLCLLS